MIAKKRAPQKECSDVVRTSVSWDEDLLTNAQTIAKMVGYRHSFSAYVNDVVRKDIEWRTTGRNEKLRELASA